MWQSILKLLGLGSKSGPAPSLPNSPSASKPNSMKGPTTASKPEKKNYRETKVTTPNKSSKKIHPQAIVLHHSGGSYNGGVSWIKNPASKVSYHCLIARDGRRTVFGKDTDRMWHAGVSSYKGRRDANSWSIGVSFEGDSNKEPLSEEMIESAIEYIKPRMEEWGIKMDMVLDHRIVSSPRKNDLNPEEYRKFITRLKKAVK
jgi:N-acetyl-anhydromuramyl-L-alanine amidase AmpD